MPKDSPFGRDMAHKVLEVSEFFIAGEIALQKGDWKGASGWLEKAASIEATLSYGEPPQYLQPSRHTLGAVYMKAGQFEKAESTYRKDLNKWEGNGWSLFGLSRALQAQGKMDEAISEHILAKDHQLHTAQLKQQRQFPHKNLKVPQVNVSI